MLVHTTPLRTAGAGFKVVWISTYTLLRVFVFIERIISVLLIRSERKITAD
jgi:hypothetical protein